MTPRRHLSVVPASGAPVPTPPEPFQTMQRPPIKPRRPAAAVRKSLRAALAAAASVTSTVDAADARCVPTARRAARELQAYAQRLTRLADELQHAVECEARYHLWKRGRLYVD